MLKTHNIQLCIEPMPNDKHTDPMNSRFAPFSPGHTPTVEGLHVVSVLSEGGGRVPDGITPLLGAKAGLRRIEEARYLQGK